MWYIFLGHPLRARDIVSATDRWQSLEGVSINLHGSGYLLMYAWAGCVETYGNYERNKCGTFFWDTLYNEICILRYPFCSILPGHMPIRVFHFWLFFSECLISTGFPLFHLFNEVWWPLFPFLTDIMIRSNSPKFSVFAPFGVKVTHVNTMANRALTPWKLSRARDDNIGCSTDCGGWWHHICVNSSRIWYSSVQER